MSFNKFIKILLCILLLTCVKYSYADTFIEKEAEAAIDMTDSDAVAAQKQAEASCFKQILESVIKEYLTDDTISSNKELLDFAVHKDPQSFITKYSQEKKKKSSTTLTLTLRATVNKTILENKINKLGLISKSGKKLKVLILIATKENESYKYWWRAGTDDERTQVEQNILTYMVGNKLISASSDSKISESIAGTSPFLSPEELLKVCKSLNAEFVVNGLYAKNTETSYNVTLKIYSKRAETFVASLVYDIEADETTLSLDITAKTLDALSTATQSKSAFSQNAQKLIFKNTYSYDIFSTIYNYLKNSKYLAGISIKTLKANTATFVISLNTDRNLFIKDIKGINVGDFIVSFTDSSSDSLEFTISPKQE